MKTWSGASVSLIVELRSQLLETSVQSFLSFGERLKLQLENLAAGAKP